MERARRGSHRDDAERAPCGLLRLCAATRQERDADDLIRFVASPDGAIVPDVSRRLPGRGVWISADKATVAAAVKSKAFARSLKRPVTVREDLAEWVDALLRRRALESLSLANKAGLATCGFAQIEAMIEKNDASVLVHGSGAAAGGQDKLDRKYLAIRREAGRPAPIVTAFSIEEISLAMGRSNVVHAALKHGGAAEKFLNETERLLRYRSCAVDSGNAQLPAISEG